MSEKKTTQLLGEFAQGEALATAELFERVYDELRELAAKRMHREGAGNTLQPSALVNEAYLKLAGQRNVEWKNRGHFMAMASTMMRRILIDHARERAAAKRGGDFQRLDLDHLRVGGDDVDYAGLVALSECLDNLEKLNPRHAKTVDMKVFGGLTIEEMAEALDVSPATVKNDWRTARAWLRSQLEPEM